MDENKRIKMSAELKAEQELEKELRGGWGNVSTLSWVHRPDEAGKRTKPKPNLHQLDTWD